MTASESEDLRRRDAEARLAAQRLFDRPLVLEAGAGTGKTTTLVARVVAWCLGPGWARWAERGAAGDPPGRRSVEAGPHDRIAAAVLSRVAAITFTEAAAGEMATRVGEAFAQIERGECPQGVAPEVLPDADAERRDRARALIGALDLLVVRTIHAFCRRLLARHPLDAGLHPAFEVDADGRQRSRAVREVLEDALRGASAPADHPDLFALTARGIGPDPVEAALADLVEAGVSVRDFERDWLTGASALEAFARLAADAGAVLDAARALDDVPARNKNTLALLDALRETLVLASEARAGAGKGAAELHGALRSVWTDGARKRLKAWSSEDFNKGESGCLAGTGAAIPERAIALLRILGPLLEVDSEALLQAQRALTPLLASVREWLRRRGVVSFSELLRAARDLLRDQPAVRSLERRDLDLLLVDEFQDTDPVQCEIVHYLAEDGPAAERPSLFLVGDPKQSIYGWRGADLGAYDAFVDGVVERGGQRLSLCVNHRSVPAVLDEVERVIRPVMQRQPGVQPAFQRLVAADALAEEPGFGLGGRAPVEHWVSRAWDAEVGAPAARTSAQRAAEIEARAVARDIAALHREHGVAWSEVAILFRATGDLEIYLEALRAAGVPTAVERDRSYYRRREIVDAAALLRCTLDPNDLLALFTFLRSPAVGVPDAAWLPLWARGFPARVASLGAGGEEALAACVAVVREAAAELPDDVPGLERIRGWDLNLVNAIESLAALRLSFELDAPDVFIDALRDRSLLEAGEAARYLGVHRVANLDRFFRQLTRELTEDGDVQGLLRRLRVGVREGREADEAQAPDASFDAVRVMTIHKAKGLSFGHVYAVQLHKQGGGSRDRRGVEIGVRAGEREVRLFGSPSPGYALLSAERLVSADAERVRMLYVAMTRPRQRLVLVGRWPSQPELRPLWRSGSLLELLFARDARPEDLDARMLAATDAAKSRLDAVGALWRFPDREAEAASGLPVPAPALLGSGQASDGLETLYARGVRARAEMRRYFAVTASGQSHAADAEDGEPISREERAGARFASVQDAEETTGASSGEAVPSLVRRSAAQAAGTAVHGLLEDFDIAAEPGAELARQRARLGDRVRALAGSEDVDEVLRLAEETLMRFESGLFAAFCDLRERIVARELPVWLAPELVDSLAPADAAAPAGFGSGAVDLLYRDADTGRLVVADYKTDRVEATGLDERARRYQPQGAFYAAAVEAALGLDYTPRVEFWFLYAGQIACDVNARGPRG